MDATDRHAAGSLLDFRRQYRWHADRRPPDGRAVFDRRTVAFRRGGAGESVVFAPGGDGYIPAIFHSAAVS